MELSTKISIEKTDMENKIKWHGKVWDLLKRPEYSAVSTIHLLLRINEYLEKEG